MEIGQSASVTWVPSSRSVASCLQSLKWPAPHRYTGPIETEIHQLLASWKWTSPASVTAVLIRSRWRGRGQFLKCATPASVTGVKGMRRSVKLLQFWKWDSRASVTNGPER